MMVSKPELLQGHHIVQEFLEGRLCGVNRQVELGIAADGAFRVGRLQH